MFLATESEIETLSAKSRTNLLISKNLAYLKIMLIKVGAAINLLKAYHSKGA